MSNSPCRGTGLSGLARLPGTDAASAHPLAGIDGRGHQTLGGDTAMAKDRTGLALSTSPDAAQPCVDGVDRMLAAWPSAQARMEQAVATDPDFALGHAAMARQLQTNGRAADPRAAAARARTLAASAGRPGQP
jgi:hypothetical protein